MIGITFALPAESSDLVRQLREPEREDQLTIGKIGNRDVAIVHTGVGATNCSRRLEILIHKARPKFVISAGFAGAVSDELKVGDLVLAENFSDPTLVDGAERIISQHQPRRIKLFTSPSIVDLLSERNEIARESGAAAVDMETGVIVAVCKAHGVPLLSLRAISDTPEQTFPTPPAALFDIQRQRTNYGRLFAYLLREPAAISRLVRFARRIARARAKLAEAVIALVRGI